MRGNMSGSNIRLVPAQGYTAAAIVRLGVALPRRPLSVPDGARNGRLSIERMTEFPNPRLSRYCRKGLEEHDATVPAKKTPQDRIRFVCHRLA